jgi:hypothetical protein
MILRVDSFLASGLGRAARRAASKARAAFRNESYARAAGESKEEGNKFKVPSCKFKVEETPVAFNFEL